MWTHMRELGLGALAHANRHAAYSALENPRWPELSVLQAAHAAELLIRARIAEEHPLLAFEQLPSSGRAVGSTLDVQDLFNHGRTLRWADLPERLWATTGLAIPGRSRFDRFGRLRNGLQHFGPAADLDPSDETLRFVFEVVDPFINDCWGLFAIDYDEDSEPYVYLVHALAHRELPFRVSPGAAACFDHWEVDWSQLSPDYAAEMQKRVSTAGA
ncbi:MAG: hypothetical protein OXH52_16345 [Gammaproteobacteria bacterium]|nr:hypothetical protein [Gammaproteobacteria bacterium]